MNNATEQAAEATSSEETRPTIESITAKTKTKDIISALNKDLHTLILITISAVYCFDCFSLLYLLRFVSQNQSTHAGIRVVLTANVVCILTHIFHALPQPGPREFWNHGGLVVDFVGEKPASRFKLILLDFLILALQILYLSLHYKKLVLDPSVETQTAAAAQDLEAEEAGISRAGPTEQSETEEGIEMQSLLPAGSADHEAMGTSTETHDNQTIALGRIDFQEVFWNTGRATSPNETTNRLRLFLERLDAIRQRRMAQEARLQSAPAPSG